MPPFVGSPRGRQKNIPVDLRKRESASRQNEKRQKLVRYGSAEPNHNKIKGKKQGEGEGPTVVATDRPY